MEEFADTAWIQKENEARSTRNQAGQQPCPGDGSWYFFPAQQDVDPRCHDKYQEQGGWENELRPTAKEPKARSESVEETKPRSVDAQCQNQKQSGDREIEYDSASFPINVTQGYRDQQRSDGSDKERHFPEITTSPINRSAQTSKESRCDDGQEIFWWEAEHRGKIVIEFLLADALPGRGKSGQKLCRTQGNRHQITARNRWNGSSARRRFRHRKNERLYPGRHRRIKKVLDVTGQYLETDRRAGEEKSTAIALPYPRFKSEKNPRCPCHGAKVRQVACINMGKDRAGKRHDKSSQSGRPWIEPTTGGPSFYSPSENHEMDQNRKIERTSQGQAEKEQVGRIEHR